MSRPTEEVAAWFAELRDETVVPEWCTALVETTDVLAEAVESELGETAAELEETAAATSAVTDEVGATVSCCVKPRQARATRAAACSA